MFRGNRMPEDGEFPNSSPGVAPLDERQAAMFLLDHIRNSNLKRIGETAQRAPDFRFASNQEFWDELLHGRRMALRWVELTHFKMVDWFPRTPGLYHTSNAKHARQEAEHYVQEENGIRFYAPVGKMHMVEGGTGSIRFKPITIENEEHWLCTATTDGYCHSGVPLAIPNSVMQKIDPRFTGWFKIAGQVKFLPKFLEEYFYHSTRIPQVYVLVDSVKLLEKSTFPTPVKITPMVFFNGDLDSLLSEERRLRFSQRAHYERFGSRRGEQGNVTYVTCGADSFDELDRAADWLEWYASRYNGEIITNFDQQRPVFQDAPFSLQNVMSGKLDRYRLQEYHIDHAEIICDTVKHIHSEATTMTQIEVKLGDGNVIHGDFVVANSIKDSFNKASSSNAPDELKELLKKLTTAVGKMTEELPKETAQQAARDIDTLVAEATSPTPRKQWWQLSVEGLKKAAQDIGEIGKPVLELLGLLVPLLLSI